MTLFVNHHAIYSISLIILQLASALVASAGPAAKLQLSQSGLDYAANIAVDVLARDIHGKTIPDQRGTKHMEVGNVNWEVNNIRIVDFTKPGTTVGVDPDTAITWGIRDAGIKTEGNWKYEYKVWRIKARDSGTFEMTIGGASATLRVTLGATPAGQPTVTVLSCSCSINSVSVRFRGGQSWLYNLFSGAIEGVLRREMEKKLCEEATKAINKSGNEELETLNLDVELGGGFGVDCGLVGSPVMGRGYIESYHKGEATSPGPPLSPIASPSSPLPLSNHSPSRMITVYISQRIANAVGHTYHGRGIISRRITREELKHAHARNFLSTSCSVGTCIGSLFPAAARLYPNTTIELDLTTTESPTLMVTGNLTTVRFSGQMNVVANLTSGEMVTIMSLRVGATLNLVAEIQGSTLKSRVVSFVPQISVGSSAIGDLIQEGLDQLFEHGLNDYLVPDLNEIGELGVEIPTLQGVRLVAPTLEMVEGAMIVSADVVYTR